MLFEGGRSCCLKAGGYAVEGGRSYCLKAGGYAVEGGRSYCLKAGGYELGSTGRMALDEAFAKEKLNPTYVMTAMDVGVIKRYVSLGIGIGIIASVSTSDNDPSLTTLSLRKVVPECYAWLCYSKNLFLQKHMYDFIQKLSPPLTKQVVDEAFNTTLLVFVIIII